MGEGEPHFAFRPRPPGITDLATRKIHAAVAFFLRLKPLLRVVGRSKAAIVTLGRDAMVALADFGDPVSGVFDGATHDFLAFRELLAD